MANKTKTTQVLLRKVNALKKEQERAIKETIRLKQDAVGVISKNGKGPLPANGQGEQYKVMVEAMNEGALVLSKDAAILFCNERFCEMTGKNQKILKGTLFSELILDEEKEEFSRFFRDGFEMSHVLRFYLICKNKTIMPVQISVKRIKEAGAKVLSMVVTDLSDITKSIETLVKSEIFFKSLIENSADMITLIDRKGKIIFTTPAVERVYGYTEKEILAMNSYRTILHPDDLEKAKVHFEEVLRSPLKPVPLTARNRRKDGRYIWVEGTITNLLDEPGINAMVCNFRDISLRKHAEEGLEKLNRELKLLYEAQNALSKTLDLNSIYDKTYDIVSEIMPCDSMVISSYSKEDNMLRCLSVWANGQKLEVADLPALPLAPEGYGIQSPVIRSGESKLILDYNSYYKKSINKFSKSDGKITTRAKKLYSSALVVPVKTEGNVIGTIQVLSYKTSAFNEDNLRLLELLTAPISAATLNASLYQQAQNEIIEKISKEKQLSEIRKNLEEAQRISHLGSWVMDVKSNMVYNSEEIYRIVGIKPPNRSIDFETSMSFIYDEDRESLRSIIGNAIHQKKSYVNECRIKRPDGEIRYVRVMGEPVPDEKGSLKRMQGTMQDITDIKRMTDELMKSVNEKELMLKEIHHRVKNNLQVVSSLLRLQSDKIEDKSAVEYLKQSEQRVKSMGLIHQQLYRTKDLTRINFNDYINELCSYLFFAYGVNKGRINLKTSVDKIYFGIDTALPCGLIVNELLTNSIKHAFPGGRKGNIEISLSKNKDNRNNLIIKDDGVGAGNLNFENASTLGMELVNMLTEQLEGKIEVSTASGTEIRISFRDLVYKDRI